MDSDGFTVVLHAVKVFTVKYMFNAGIFNMISQWNRHRYWSINGLSTVVYWLKLGRTLVAWQHCITHTIRTQATPHTKSCGLRKHTQHSIDSKSYGESSCSDMAYCWNHTFIFKLAVYHLSEKMPNEGNDMNLPQHSIWRVVEILLVYVFQMQMPC